MSSSGLIRVGSSAWRSTRSVASPTSPRSRSCSDSALARVAAQGARDLTRFGLCLQRLDPLSAANRFAVDGVLKSLQESLQPLDPLLQGLDPLRVSGRRVVGWRLRLRCLAATQLNDPLQQSGEAAGSPRCGPFGYEGPSIQASLRVGSRLTSSTRPATTSRSRPAARRYPRRRDTSRPRRVPRRCIPPRPERG